MRQVRLLIDPPASGAWNMAVDEALLETAAREEIATLRFYQWEAPTLSLGYFQSAADRQQHAASRECPLVRRASGGGAIVHDRELTYSIALPHSDARSGRAAELYDAAHETLVATLAEFGVEASLYRPPEDCNATGSGVFGAHRSTCWKGHSPPKTLDPSTSGPARQAGPTSEPFLCFQRRACRDVVCGPVKIAGSAQRRRRRAVLQHGGILLARSACAPELPGIAEVGGVVLTGSDLTARWTNRLAEALGWTVDKGRLSSTEREWTQAFSATKFAG